MKGLLRRLLLLLARLYGAAGERAAARQAHQSLVENPRVLLIRPDYLGDLVLTTPVLQAVKAAAPNVHLTMMVGPWSREVVASHPAVDQLLTCPIPGVRGANKKALKPFLLMRVAKQLRSGNYDLAINLRLQSWWVSVLLYLARIPRRIGYDSKFSKPFLTHALTVRPNEHLTVSSLRLISAGLQALGYPPLAEPYTPERYPLHFTPAEEDQHWVTQRLRAERIDPAALLIVIHPGAGAAVKLWRSEAWAHCATRLSQSSADTMAVHFILTGTPQEQPLLEAITKATTTTARMTIMTGMTIGQLAALLQHAQLVLGVDSGPLHLAVAMRTPTVRIYGPIDPRIFGPWGSREQHAVVLSTHRCPTCAAIPCGHLSFPPEELAAHPCVRLVPEQQVLDVIAQRFLPFADRRLSSTMEIS